MVEPSAVELAAASKAYIVKVSVKVAARSRAVDTETSACSGVQILLTDEICSQSKFAGTERPASMATSHHDRDGARWTHGGCARHHHHLETDLPRGAVKGCQDTRQTPPPHRAFARFAPVHGERNQTSRVSQAHDTAVKAQETPHTRLQPGVAVVEPTPAGGGVNNFLPQVYIDPTANNVVNANTKTQKDFGNLHPPDTCGYDVATNRCDFGSGTRLHRRIPQRNHDGKAPCRRQFFDAQFTFVTRTPNPKGFALDIRACSVLFKLWLFTLSLRMHLKTNHSNLTGCVHFEFENLKHVD